MVALYDLDKFKGIDRNSYLEDSASLLRSSSDDLLKSRIDMRPNKSDGVVYHQQWVAAWWWRPQAWTN